MASVYLSPEFADESPIRCARPRTFSPDLGVVRSLRINTRTASQPRPLDPAHDVFRPTDGPGWRGYVSHSITALDHYTGSPFPPIASMTDRVGVLMTSVGLF